jgi:hypothetical protein
VLAPTLSARRRPSSPDPLVDGGRAAEERAHLTYAKRTRPFRAARCFRGSPPADRTERRRWQLFLEARFSSVVDLRRVVCVAEHPLDEEVLRLWSRVVGLIRLRSRFFEEIEQEEPGGFRSI